MAKSLRLIPRMHNDMTDQDILDRVSAETPATVGICSCVVLSQPNSPPVDTSNQINIVASKLEQVVELWPIVRWHMVYSMQVVSSDMIF